MRNLEMMIKMNLKLNMKKINIIVGRKVISYIKSCKYFKISLGFSTTLENKKGDRILSKNDEFAISYNYQYKTAIYKQGSIGNVDIYLDHYINSMEIATYCNLEELILEFDIELYKEKGIDFIIGSILKRVEENYDTLVSNKTDDNDNVVKSGNKDMLTKNPGNVSYSDIIDYMNKKRSI